MASRIPSHQRSNGLLVSGPPDQPPVVRPPTISSGAVPYTGGDVRLSGDLGKMLNVPGPSGPPQPPTVRPSRNSSSSSQQHNSGSRPNSGQVSRRPSGPILQPTGLITSGPLNSSGPLDRTASVRTTTRVVYGPAVTSLTNEVKVNFGVSKTVLVGLFLAAMMGLVVGGFLMKAVKKWIVLAAVVGVLTPVVVLIVWNYLWGKRGLAGFVRSYPNASLIGAKNGQFIKVTGVVTCGCVPLVSSYKRQDRCVYVSTELSEPNGCGSKSTNTKLKHSEKYATDFYISDELSGARALVKVGYGAKVAPFVKPATVMDVTRENRDVSPDFLRWLADRNLSTDDRIMRLKERYIKEGDTVSVMGVIRIHENVVMIVHPQQPFSTGFQWSRCLFPTYVEDLILTCDETKANVIPV